MTASIYQTSCIHRTKLTTLKINHSQSYYTRGTILGKKRTHNLWIYGTFITLVFTTWLVPQDFQSFILSRWITVINFELFWHLIFAIETKSIQLVVLLGTKPTGFINTVNYYKANCAIGSSEVKFLSKRFNWMVKPWSMESWHSLFGHLNLQCN